jgi:hypothetical protein
MLSNIKIKAIKPAAVRKEYSDGKNGLALVVQPSGVKSWAVRYRSPVTTKPAKFTIGPLSTYSLAQARVEARSATAKVDRGIDPAAEKRKELERRDEAAVNTLRGVTERYFQLEGSKLRALRERKGVFDRHILPRLGDRPIASITRNDVTRLLDHIEVGVATAERDGKRTATLALSYLARLFNWYAIRDENFWSPVVRGMARGQTVKRDRVLTDEE